jgi:hypothetical protein
MHQEILSAKITLEGEVEHQATELWCLVCYKQRDTGDSKD